jgi:hypothetical protein
MLEVHFFFHFKLFSVRVDFCAPSEKTKFILRNRVLKKFILLSEGTLGLVIK